MPKTHSHHGWIICEEEEEEEEEEKRKKRRKCEGRELPNLDEFALSSMGPRR
jgi:hypothetical protein